MELTEEAMQDMVFGRWHMVPPERLEHRDKE